MHASTPAYAEWCLAADARYAYRYYRKVLGMVAAGSRKRWVLKTSCHLWGHDTRLEVFLDACIVFTRRDIMTSISLSNRC